MKCGGKKRSPHLISSEALSSAPAQSSAQRSCRLDSRKLPVDLSSIPAMSLWGQAQSHPGEEALAHPRWRRRR